jgi:ubiquinone/menaquinone biosynthesis C-methylase UbiE
MDRLERRRYTHGHHESVVRSHRWRTAENSAAYLLPRLTRGQSLLDVGCGPGTITLDLARCVEPGFVVGIDASPDIIEQARVALRRRQLEHVTFEIGDVYALDFDSASFGVVHAHQLLQHLTDPITALREMRRVCVPGGVVALREADYEAMTWYPANEGLERWLALYRATARADGGEPDAGRHLVAWAREAGFSAIDATVSGWCFATPEDRAWWSESWAERVTTSTLAEHVLEHGLATRAELATLASAWVEWATHDDAWFAVLHGEIICRP